MCIHLSNTSIFLLSACRKLFLNLKEAQVTNPQKSLTSSLLIRVWVLEKLHAGSLSLCGWTLRLDWISQGAWPFGGEASRQLPEPSAFSSAKQGARRKPEGKRHGSWIPKHLWCLGNWGLHSAFPGLRTRGWTEYSHVPRFNLFHWEQGGETSPGLWVSVAEWGQGKTEGDPTPCGEWEKGVNWGVCLSVCLSACLSFFYNGDSWCSPGWPVLLYGDQISLQVVVQLFQLFESWVISAPPHEVITSFHLRCSPLQLMTWGRSRAEMVCFETGIELGCRLGGKCKKRGKIQC